MKALPYRFFSFNSLSRDQYIMRQALRARALSFQFSLTRSAAGAARPLATPAHAFNSLSRDQIGLPVDDPTWSGYLSILSHEIRDCVEG